MRRIENWINGLSAPPTTSNYTPVLNPASGAVAFEASSSSELDGVRAVQSAQRALKAWADTSTEARLKIVDDFLRAGLDREALARDLVEALGRPITLARRDVERALGEVRTLAARAGAWPSNDEFGIRMRLRQPVGVVAVIVGRERALSFLLRHLAAAVLSGNAIVIKSSPIVAALCQRVVEGLRAPAGVINLVHGSADLGRFLVRHPGTARIAFAGESRHGSDVLAEAAPLIKPVHLELSTKNVIIVMKDADLQKLVPRVLHAALDGFAKILVQDDLFNEAEQLLGVALDNLVVGDPSLSTVDVGPLNGDMTEFTRWRELANAENGRVLGRVEDAGRFVRPAAFSELTNCSEIHQTAIAGPLLTLNSFKYVTDAVKWANNSPFGGAVSVWTKNLPQALKLASELDVDGVAVNAFPANVTGGRKLSGFGGGDVLRFHNARKSVCFST